MDDFDDLLDEVMFARLSGAELPEMSLNDYRQWIRDIPLPTEKQMKAFAEYVAGARSWYKHLPLHPPGKTFHFYIDPHAGMDRVVSVSGEVRLRERTQETDAFHYSWMTTAEYRERFGYLAFSCARGSALFSDEYLDGEHVLVDHNRLYPVLQVSGDTAMMPPSEVLEAGACQLTALIHPRATADYVASWLARHDEALRDDRSPDPSNREWAAIVKFWRDNGEHAKGDPIFASLVRAEKERLQWDMACAMSRMFSIITYHHEGFERENVYHEALGLGPPDFKSGQLTAIISLIAPAFLDGLFQDRPCIRRLRYISSDEPEAFKLGEVYESVTFNGGTYQIKDAEGKLHRIGYAYFERLT